MKLKFCAVLICLAGTLAPGPVFAQLAQGNNRNLLSTAPVPLIGNDVAYDPAHNVYLAVIGYGDIYGAFATASGDLITWFKIGTANRDTPYGHYPRCVYSPELNGGQGGFLVTWHQSDTTVNFVHSAVVAYPAGVISADQAVSDGGQSGSYYGAGTALAYSPTSHRILVAWATIAWGIQGRFIDASTGALAGPITQYVSAGGARDPSLAWNPATDEFGLANAGWDSTSAFVAFRRVRASDGAVSAPATLGFGPNTFSPGIAVNNATNHFIMGWSTGAGANGVDFDQTGALSGAVRLLSSRVGTPTSFSIAFNPVSASFLAVSEDVASLEVAGVELDPSGAPKALAGTLTTGASTGSYVPRVTARTNAKEWNISYARNLNTLADQIVSTSSTGGAVAPTPLGLSVAANKTMPVSEGTSVTWTATASGGTGSTEYQFWRYTSATGWTVAQSYSSTNTLTWAPPAGTNAIQVWARNVGSTAPYDTYAAPGTFTVTAPKAAFTLFAVNQTFPLAFNIPITWTASASAGANAVEYKWWRYTEGQGWSIAQDWSATNTFTWYPSVGVHAVQAWARQVGSTANYEDWRSSGNFTIGTGSPARLTGLTSNAASPSSPNSPITWTATASGGSGPLEYQFWLYRSSTSSWMILQDWSSSNQASWTPGVFNTGLNSVQAWVRTTGNTASYEDWRSTGFFNITASTDLTLTPNRSLSGLSESAGNSVTWTAQMLPSSGTWEYEFWTWSVDPTTNVGSWRLHRAYDTSQTFTWFPAKGTHALQVWARQVGSLTNYERWVSTGFFVVNP